MRFCVQACEKLKGGDARAADKILHDEQLELATHERTLRRDAYITEKALGDRQLRHGFGTQALETYELVMTKALEGSEKDAVEEVMTKSRTLEKNKDDGRRCFAYGNFAEAVKAYSAAVVIAPESDRLKDKLATVEHVLALQDEGEQLMAKGQFGEATEIFGQALELDPDDITLQETIDKATEKSGKREDVKMLRQKAELAIKEQDFSQAEAFYVQALAITPTDRELKKLRNEVRQHKQLKIQWEKLRNLAKLHTSTKKYEDAFVVYSKALELLEKHGDLLTHETVSEPEVADMQRKKNEVDVLRQVQTLKAHGNRKVLLGEYKEAIALFRKALELDPGNAEVEAVVVGTENRMKVNALSDDARRAEAEAKELEAGDKPHEAATALARASEALLAALQLDPRNLELDQEHDSVERRRRGDEFMAQGDELLAAKQFEKAKLEYAEALRLLPESDTGELSRKQRRVHVLATAQKVEHQAEQLKASGDLQVHPQPYLTRPTACECSRQALRFWYREHTKSQHDLTTCFRPPFLVTL
eukprot:SAG11_NODE_1619_length_4571_cov_8.743292_2_plen_533_part_00